MVEQSFLFRAEHSRVFQKAFFLCPIYCGKFEVYDLISSVIQPTINYLRESTVCGGGGLNIEKLKFMISCNHRSFADCCVLST